jgi:hypothetical protein
LNVPSSDCDEALLLRVAHQISDELLKGELPYPTKYEHFTPQCDFVEVDGLLVIKNISLFGDFKTINSYFQRHGLNAISGAKNVSLTPKPGLFLLASTIIKPLVRRFLPNKIKEGLWVFLTSKGFYQPASNRSIDFLIKDVKLKKFIDSFYEKDFLLYEKIKKR